MTTALKASARHWIAGTVLAFVGVAVARLVAPGLESRPRAWLTLAGQITALGGLFVILLGIRRRLRSATPAGHPE
ncbi:MAG: hypothetical protein NTV51_18495 [Verrucomicrobia bacterium]|nr:hypothetical protein [Verrucomicrobiota bacterium]